MRDDEECDKEREETQFAKYSTSAPHIPAVSSMPLYMCYRNVFLRISFASRFDYVDAEASLHSKT